MRASMEACMYCQTKIYRILLADLPFSVPAAWLAFMLEWWMQINNSPRYERNGCHVGRARLTMHSIWEGGISDDLQIAFPGRLYTINRRNEQCRSTWRLHRGLSLTPGTIIGRSGKFMMPTSGICRLDPIHCLATVGTCTMHPFRTVPPFFLLPQTCPPR